MEYINEKELRKFPKIVSYECTEKILEQMKNKICSIKLPDGSLGTGFFCKIPFPTKEKLLPVLVTNNHIIDDTLLENKNSSIMIFTKDTHNYKTFQLNNRKYYTNKEFDITFIEIKENQDEIYNFLELDDFVIESIIDNKNNGNNINNYYIGETIYILQYPEGNLSVSYGLLDSISNKKNFDFCHLCSTKLGSSGSPILNISNNKVFGIHKQASSKNNYNKGSFLNIPIQDFIKQNLFQMKSNYISDVNKIENKITEGKNDKTEIIETRETNKMSYQEFNKKLCVGTNELTHALYLGNKRYGNEILEIVSKMYFRELKDLRLDYNLISDISALEKFQFLKLEILWLGNNKINDISVFKNVKFNNLKKLFLNNNNISDINAFEETNFQKLEELNLDDNHISNINILEKANFPSIKFLSFFKNDISDINVLRKVEFNNLSTLNIRSNKIDKNLFMEIINELKKKIKWFKI